MERVTCVSHGAGWEVLGVSELVWALPILKEHGGKWDMCLCFGCSGCGVDSVGGSVWAAWVRGLRGVGWCYVCVCCESELFMLMGRSRYLCIVLGGFLRILGAPIVQSCCTLSISAS